MRSTPRMVKPLGSVRKLYLAQWPDNPYTLKLGADLLQWQNPTVITDNILLLIDLGFVLLALLCFAFGFWRRQKGK